MQEHATDDDPWAHAYSDTENAHGFGPYCISSWQKGTEFVLEANPNYFRGQPQFQKVTIRKVPQAANRVAAIQTGDVDIVTSLSPQDINALRSDENVNVLSWQNNEILALGFNFALEPWNTPEGKLVRQALALAMPVAEIIEADYLGDALPWLGLSESTYFGFVPIDTYAERDIDRARELLAEAGFPNGEGLEAFDGAFQLNYVSERREVLEPVANRIKTAAAEIGIDIELNPITAQEYNDRELTKKDMPLFLRDLVRPFGPDVGYTSLLFYVTAEAGGLVNAGNYSNEEFDSEFFASQVTAGDERLGHLLRQQEIVMDELPLIPILERPSQIVLRNGLTCWQTGTSNIIGFWYLTVEGSDRACTQDPRN
jgi:peptide/nickel transport system substrate-binding protein